MTASEAKQIRKEKNIFKHFKNFKKTSKNLMLKKKIENTFKHFQKEKDRDLKYYRWFI